MKTRPVSIVSIYRISALGGAERYAAFLCSHYAKQGHRVFLMSRGEFDASDIGKYFSVDLSNIEYLKLPDRPSRFPNEIYNFFCDLYKFLRVRILRADNYFECSYKSNSFGGGKINIYICHFPHKIDDFFVGGWRRTYVRALKGFLGLLLGKGRGFIASYDKVLANSRFTQGYINSRWGVESEVLYPPSPQVSVQGSTEKRRIVSTGRFDEYLQGIPHKGQHHLISAFIELLQKSPESWELHLIGSCTSPSGYAYLDKLTAISQGLPVYFHVNAGKAEMDKLLSTAEFYWHAQGYGQDFTENPETQEHFGISTVEAMSAGCIPVVIDSAGPKEIVEGYGGETWNELSELVEKTIMLEKSEVEELDARRMQVMERAATFSDDAFSGKLDAIISSLSGVRDND